MARDVVSWAAEAADSWFFGLASLVLARVVCLRERPSEAMVILDEAARRPQSPDLEVVVNSRSVRAMALARLGRLEEAETLAREAVDLAAPTNFLRFHADALVVLADVLSRSGRPSEAATRSSRPSCSTSARATSFPRRTPGPCSRSSLRDSRLFYLPGGERGALRVLPALRRAAAGGGRVARVAQDGVGGVLRCGRLDGDRRAARSGAVAAVAAALLRGDAAGLRGPRRPRARSDRRCRDGGLRPAGGARGRRPAGRPGSAGDARAAGGLERRAGA